MRNPQKPPLSTSSMTGIAEGRIGLQTDDLVFLCFLWWAALLVLLIGVLVRGDR